MREIEVRAKGVSEGISGGFEEQIEEVAAFAEDAAEHFRDGEDELAVGDGVADGVRDPSAGLEGAALVTGGAVQNGVRVWLLQQITGKFEQKF